MITIKRRLNVTIQSRGRIAIRPFDPDAEPLLPKPIGRVPRIARLMSLATPFVEMLRTGEATEMIELADADT